MLLIGKEIVDFVSPRYNDYRRSQRSSANVSTIFVYFFSYLYLLTFFGALGGFLFGYDTGVISGAMIPLSSHFNLSTELQELVVSVTIAGAILGAFLSGFLNDRLGRRPVLLLGSFVFVVGAVVMGVAGHVVLLVIGRGTVGLGIGK